MSRNEIKAEITSLTNAELADEMDKIMNHDSVGCRFSVEDQFAVSQEWNRRKYGVIPFDTSLPTDGPTKADIPGS